MGQTKGWHILTVFKQPYSRAPTEHKMCNLGAFCPAAHSSPPWYQCSDFYAQFRFLHRPHASATFARPSRSILNYRIVKGSAGADSPIKIIIIIIITKTCSAVPRCCSCLHADAWGMTCRQNLTAYHPVAELCLAPTN